MAIDFSSATWNEVARWADEQLKSARLRNDSADLTLERTSVLRGEIAVLKRLLALPAAAARDLQSGSAFSPSE